MPSGVYIKNPLTEKLRREKIGKAHKGKKLSEEHRIKISKNNTKFWLGKKHSEETKKKISEANKGKSYNLSNKGKRFSEEHKKKISIAHKGKSKFWLLGRKHSMETRRKISLALIGKQMSEESKRKMSLNKMENPNRVFKDTSIEIKLRNWLKEQEIEFETNYPILGRPDIFIKPNIAIFADGCYWHKCIQCGFGELRQRDKEVTEELQKQGYTVIRLWEHEINKNQFNILNQLCQKK